MFIVKEKGGCPWALSSSGHCPVLLNAQRLPVACAQSPFPLHGLVWGTVCGAPRGPLSGSGGAGSWRLLLFLTLPPSLLVLPFLLRIWSFPLVSPHVCLCASFLSVCLPFACIFLSPGFFCPGLSSFLPSIGVSSHACMTKGVLEMPPPEPLLGPGARTAWVWPSWGLARCPSKEMCSRRQGGWERVHLYVDPWRCANAGAWSASS